MFTGIIESLGVVKNIVKEGDNIHISIESDFTSELKIDQSVAHNGVCLTTVAINGNEYTVTAIKETLDKSNFKHLKIGDKINLERAMILGARLDGHIVQGHVDQIGTCVAINEEDGSWLFSFEYDASIGNVTVEKGSITINGISLTCFNSKSNGFTVAIIPYTYEHTNMHMLNVGDQVNLEFDIIGKYVQRMMNIKK